LLRVRSLCKRGRPLAPWIGEATYRLGAVIRTDERYGHDGLFQGPRGWDYWNLLENPRNYQDPNLLPDKRPTYFLGQLQMPPATNLAIHGSFPTLSRAHGTQSLPDDW
jgi:hypothetical protein